MKFTTSLLVNDTISSVKWSVFQKLSRNRNVANVAYTHTVPTSIQFKTNRRQFHYIFIRTVLCYAVSFLNSCKSFNCYKWRMPLVFVFKYPNGSTQKENIIMRKNVQNSPYHLYLYKFEHMSLCLHHSSTGYIREYFVIDFVMWLTKIVAPCKTWMSGFDWTRSVSCASVEIEFTSET